MRPRSASGGRSEGLWLQVERQRPNVEQAVLPRKENSDAFVCATGKGIWARRSVFTTCDPAEPPSRAEGQPVFGIRGSTTGKKIVWEARIGKSIEDGHRRILLAQKINSLVWRTHDENEV